MITVAPVLEKKDQLYMDKGGPVEDLIKGYGMS